MQYNKIKIGGEFNIHTGYTFVIKLKTISTNTVSGGNLWKTSLSHSVTKTLSWDLAQFLESVNSETCKQS